MQTYCNGVTKKDAACIRDVWASTLGAEMQNISNMIEKFPYISMVCFLACFILRA